MFVGPNIVTDGLVFAIDAGSKKSYPGSGTMVYGLSSGNNGTLVNGTTISTTNNGVFNLDGSNDYISTTYGKDINPYNNPLSVSVWVKVTTIKNSMFISTGQGRGNSDSNQRLYISIYNGNWDWGIRGSSWSGGNIAADNNWNFVTIVIDNVNARFYLNKNQIYTKSVNSTYILNDSFLFGVHDITSYAFDGELSNISIYNRALTLQEIQQNYNALKSRFI
jgi:hypothetical protein